MLLRQVMAWLCMISLEAALQAADYWLRTTGCGLLAGGAASG